MTNSAAIAAILAVAVAVLAALLLPPLVRDGDGPARSHSRCRRACRRQSTATYPSPASLPAPLARRLEGLAPLFPCARIVRRLQRPRDHRRDPRHHRGAGLPAAARPRGHYDDLRSILVYPGAFWVEDEVHDDDGLVTRRRRELSGEAWDSQRIILSWEDVAETAQRPADGYNVVLHEFAHYLDAEGRGLAAVAIVRVAGEVDSRAAAALDAWARRPAPRIRRAFAPPSTAANPPSSILTPPKTKWNSSPSRARSSSSAGRNCARRTPRLYPLLRVLRDRPRGIWRARPQRARSRQRRRRRIPLRSRREPRLKCRKEGVARK